MSPRKKRPNKPVAADPNSRVLGARLTSPDRTGERLNGSVIRLHSQSSDSEVMFEPPSICDKICNREIYPLICVVKNIPPQEQPFLS